MRIARLFFSLLCVSVSASLLASCASPGSTATTPGQRETQGRPNGNTGGGPAPPEQPPGAARSVLVTAPNAFLGLATISAAGQLSRPTVTNTVQVTENTAGQAIFTIQYTVTSGNPYDGCAQSSTIVDPSGVVTMALNSSRGFSVNVPVPNCPGTTLYTVTTNVLSFESVPRVLGTIATQFETSDLATKPDVVASVLPVQIAGIQTFNATFVPDPAAPGVVAVGPTTFVFDGFREAVRGTLSIPGLGDGTLVGSFVRGQFFSFAAPAGNGSCAAPITCTVGMGNWVTYFLGLNAPLPANPTGQLLGPGDTIDLYPVAGVIAFGFNPFVTQPITITGPKLGSVAISL
jgi:hypothetical protein